MANPTETKCPDPWHQGDDAAPHATYVIDTGGAWSSEGYRCLTCGFQTVTLDTYVPVEKPCGECGATFYGLPDAPDERCDKCFSESLAAFIETQTPSE